VEDQDAIGIRALELARSRVESELKQRTAKLISLKEQLKELETNRDDLSGKLSGRRQVDGELPVKKASLPQLSKGRNS